MRSTRTRSLAALIFVAIGLLGALALKLSSPPTVATPAESTANGALESAPDGAPPATLELDPWRDVTPVTRTIVDVPLTGAEYDWWTKYAGRSTAHLEDSLRAVEQRSTSELALVGERFAKLIDERLAQANPDAFRDVPISITVTADNGHTWTRAPLEDRGTKPLVYQFDADANTSRSVEALDSEANWLRSQLGVAAPTPSSRAREIIQLGY